jgi:putative sigma-54 modulation protein
MKINIRGDKLEVTKAINDYIEEKINHLNKYFNNPEEIEAKIIIRSKNNLDYIEVTIPVNKLIIRAEESHKDLYAATDLALDKLESQIRKNKNKIKSKYKNVNNLEMILDFIEDEEQDTEEIVKRKNIESKPMDEEEALLQMKLLNHDFFVFKNLDEDCTSVIYKRKDNKYGIINIK